MIPIDAIAIHLFQGQVDLMLTKTSSLRVDVSDTGTSGPQLDNLKQHADTAFFTLHRAILWVHWHSGGF